MATMFLSGSSELDPALHFVALKVGQIQISMVLIMLHLEVIDQANNDGR